MKKIILLLVFVLVFGFTFSKEETIPTINLLDNNSSSVYIVYLTIPGLTTKNFSNYFNDTSDIIGLYPYVNPLYRAKLGNLFYRFKIGSLESNINNFTKYYKQKLVDHNFNNDLIKIEYTGINIDKVKIYLTSDEVKKIFKNCPNCSYSLTTN